MGRESLTCSLLTSFPALLSGKFGERSHRDAGDDVNSNVRSEFSLRGSGQLIFVGSKAVDRSSVDTVHTGGMIVAILPYTCWSV